MQAQFTLPAFGDDRLPPRFWQKVRILDNGCWEWTAAKRGGYGVFGLGTRSDGLIRAHRYAYAELVGPIPEGLQLDHLCRNRPCVNPEHLEPVTGRENTLRGESPQAQNARKTHCPRGHAYDLLNTYSGGKGGRQCDICRKERDRVRSLTRRR